MSKYSIGVYEEYETHYGAMFDEQVDCFNVNTQRQAEKLAQKLADSGKYSAVYVTYAHPEYASCFLNPVVGFDSVGKNWVM